MTALMPRGDVGDGMAASVREAVASYFEAMIEFGRLAAESGKSPAFYDLMKEMGSAYESGRLDMGLWKRMLPEGIRGLCEIEPRLAGKVKAFALIVANLSRSGHDYLGLSHKNRDLIRNIIEHPPPGHERSSLRALCQYHVSVTETIDYSLLNGIKTGDTGKNRDLADLFSVTGKVERNGGHTTEARAIRDAVSHSKFKLSSSPHGIEFKNMERGYDFRRRYTLEEFSQYVKTQTRLYWMFAMAMQLFYTHRALLANGQIGKP